MDTELDLYDTAFMSSAFHLLYQLVEGITLRGDMVDLLTIHSKDAQGPEEYGGY